MQDLKKLGLLAVAAAALMAFAASASATTVTSPTGTAATPTIHAVSEEDGIPGTKHVWLHNPNANVECDSTFEGRVESHGAGVTAKGLVSTLSFTGCTSGWAVTVNSKGSFEIHWTSGYNGTLTSSGMTTTATLNLGPPFGHITCRYATNNTHLGAIVGGNPATLDINAALPFHSGSGLCSTVTAYLTGSYVTTSSLYIDQ